VVFYQEACVSLRYPLNHTTLCKSPMQNKKAERARIRPCQRCSAGKSYFRMLLRVGRVHDLVISCLPYTYHSLWLIVEGSKSGENRRTLNFEPHLYLRPWHKRHVSDCGIARDKTGEPLAAVYEQIGTNVRTKVISSHADCSVPSVATQHSHRCSKSM
jgi:hypothetical protein